MLVERDSAWVDYVDEIPWLERGGSFIWQSERDGWRHVYRVSRDGRKVQLLTRGDFDIASVEAVDEAGGWLYYVASPDNPAYGMGMFHRFPNTMDSLRDMPESFRTGLGHDYDSHGPEAAVGIERAFEPWNRANLLPVVLPALDSVTERLADIFLGHRLSA